MSAEKQLKERDALSHSTASIKAFREEIFNSQAEVFVHVEIYNDVHNNVRIEKEIRRNSDVQRQSNRQHG